MGDGRKHVVLAHGYGFTMDEWNVVAPMLAASGRKVILFDQRGHGHSSIGSQGIGSAVMAADYRAVLEHYDVREATLVGHSMGGFLAIKTLLILAAFGNESYYDQLHKITIPCAVLIGSKDKTTPPFHADDLARLIPNAKKTTVPSKGHPLNWEAPETVCKVILT